MRKKAKPDKKPPNCFIVCTQMDFSDVVKRLSYEDLYTVQEILNEEIRFRNVCIANAEDTEEIDLDTYDLEGDG